ncbi:hypothetical protein ACFYXL_33395 [Streptomyces tsukubensis]|uniref:hypothetical protein n=1 Tax=Streptomyces tsukubensis TaxID=83656 RepID=UPI00367D9ABE
MREFAAGGEERGEGLGVRRVQGDGQQDWAELVDPVPGEAVRGECPPQSGTQHRRVRRSIAPAGRRFGRGSLGRALLDAFAECGDGGRDDLQELRGLRADLGQRPGENLQRGGRVLDGAGTPPLGPGGVGERAHRDHRALGQRVQGSGGVLQCPFQISVK